MKNIFKLVVVFLLFAQAGFAQDKDLISRKTVLYFKETKARGFISQDITYFVESDLKKVSAYENGKLKWQTDIVLTCGEPSYGKPEIEAIKLTDAVLHVSYGNRFADVNIKDGKVLTTGFE